ncbi:hypothetical protein Hanom_Chr08g00704181 [Helianthus anomalus]
MYDVCRKSHCDVFIFIYTFDKIFRVKCHFSPCGFGYFVSLVQRFHFSYVAPKRFCR